MGGMNESLAAVLRGSQEAGYTSVVQTVAGFMNAAVLLFGLAKGAGLWSLLLGYITAAVATGIGYYLRVSILYGWFDIRPKLPSRQDILTTRRYLGFLSIGSFSVLLRGETDKLVLASFASPTWVGVYAIAARMSSLVMESSNFFYVPTIAATGAMNGRGDWQGVKNLYTTMAAVFPVAAGLVSVFVLSVYDRLTVFWLGRSVPRIATILFLVVTGNAVAVILTGSRNFYLQRTWQVRSRNHLRCDQPYREHHPDLHACHVGWSDWHGHCVDGVMGCGGDTFRCFVTSSVRTPGLGNLPEHRRIDLCRPHSGRCEIIDPDLHRNTGPSSGSVIRT